MILSGNGGGPFGGVLGILLLIAAIVWMLRDERDRVRPVLVLILAGNLFYGWIASSFSGPINSNAVISMAMLLGAVVWMLKDFRDRTRLVLVIALTINLFYGWILGTFMRAEGGFLPWKFDLYLDAIDRALGVSAGSFGLRLGRGFSWTVIQLIYQMMVPMMILWLVVLRQVKTAYSIPLAYAAEMVVGPCCYAILPACGPIYAFGRTWLHPGSVTLSPIRLDGMPNAFPSLHFSTALMLVLLAKSRSWRVVAWVFLIGTGLATLTTGEHYAIDLVVAIPFACFATAIACRRFVLAMCHLGLVVGWAIAIRTAGSLLVLNPGRLRILAAATVAIGIHGAIRLYTGALQPRGFGDAVKRDAGRPLAASQNI